ncbi:MAG: YceI family protein [Gemmatimonadota bacterium]
MHRTPIAASVLLLATAFTTVAAPSFSRAQAPEVADTSRWVINAEFSEARYLVREQLAGRDLPSDAVGRTRNVFGTLVLVDGAVVPGGSEIRVDLSAMETDSNMRDNYVRRRTLVTDSFPMATFVPTELRGVPAPLPGSGTHTFQIAGQLTLKDVTRPVVWDAEADFTEGTVVGTARVAFPFTEFGITKPSVRRVLSVADSIRLELDYHFQKAGGDR